MPGKSYGTYKYTVKGIYDENIALQICVHVAEPGKRAWQEYMHSIVIPKKSKMQSKYKINTIRIHSNKGTLANSIYTIYMY